MIITLLAIFVPILFIMLLMIAMMVALFLYENVAGYLKLPGKANKVGFSLIVISVLITAINITLLFIG